MTLFAKRDKGSFTGISITIGRVFSKLRLSPNVWTILGLIPAIAAAYFLLRNEWLFAACLFIIAAAIDFIDGSVARVTGRATTFGAYLDTVVDRYVEGIIVFGLLFAGLPEWFIPAYAWILLYWFGSMMSTYVKAAALEKGLVDAEIKGGIAERAEKMIALFVAMLAAAINPLWAVYVIAAIAVLANITAFQRIAIARKLGKKV